jgi:hypothetical protein
LKIFVIATAGHHGHTVLNLNARLGSALECKDCAAVQARKSPVRDSETGS